MAVASAGVWLLQGWAQAWAQWGAQAGAQGPWAVPGPDVATGLLAGVLIAALMVGGVVWRRATVLPLALAWTGREWQLRRGAPGALEADSSCSSVVPQPPAGLCAPSSLGAGLDGSAFEVCAPQVVIDLGPWMLLRLGAAPSWHGPDWVAVSQRQVGRSWHGLRVALYGAPMTRPATSVH